MASFLYRDCIYPVLQIVESVIVANLTIVAGLGFEEVSFGSIKRIIGERFDPRHTVNVNTLISFFHTHQSQTFVRCIFDVVAKLVKINATHVSKCVVSPVGFELYRAVDGTVYVIHVFFGVQLREVYEQLLKYFCEEVAVLILVTLNIRDHLAGRHHLLVTGQIVEEGESAVEENPFQDEICYQRMEKGLSRRVITELLINIRDKLIAFQQDRVFFQYSKISFCSLSDTIEDRT